jgi:N-hydroxyarylamine O-acetyltransferase
LIQWVSDREAAMSSPIETEPVAADAVDLDAYFARIQYQGDLQPTRRVLEQLHEAHVAHIQFENLDVILGRPVRLDLASLQEKLVRQRRGGYCFEHNTLFGAVLEQLGFTVTRLGARVRIGATHITPRTHMALRIDLDGEPLLADVGFGAATLLRPIPLQAERIWAQGAWTFRLREQDGTWVLQDRTAAGWDDMFAFTLEPQYPVDYEVANHYISTHSHSPFVNSVIVQRATPDARYVVWNRDYTVRDADRTTARTIADEAELRSLLAGTFGLELAEGAKLFKD